MRLIIRIIFSLITLSIIYAQDPPSVKWNQIKTENYQALEASQTRYQGELEIQRTNFQRRIEELKAKLQSFDV